MRTAPFSLAISLALLAAPSHAEIRAVIVGVSDYLTLDADLKGPSNDARLMAETLALRGVKYRATDASRILGRNLLVYGVGGIVAPFAGIWLIDMLVRLIPGF
ncbi:MAG: hypothetical protein EOO67_12040 [Microbacterium sp.]|nr:MAG: hypothetical protein EOO67_12040 [Microbacterium sp.]